MSRGKSRATAPHSGAVAIEHETDEVAELAREIFARRAMNPNKTAKRNAEEAFEAAEAFYQVAAERGN